MPRTKMKTWTRASMCVARDFVAILVLTDSQSPRLDYSSMLVFSPATLPKILNSLIANYRPRFKDATPANTLYMLARFAALTCDHNWLEDLFIGATDAIEETFFVSAFTWTPYS